jgi:hypothetical protein
MSTFLCYEKVGLAVDAGVNRSGPRTTFGPFTTPGIRTRLHLAGLPASCFALPRRAVVSCETSALCAEQYMEPGTVIVCQNGHVTFAANEGWLLSEVDLHFASSPDQIS